MKTKFTFCFIALLLGITTLNAQNNTFPAAGKVGIGTITPATKLQVIGAVRMGNATDYTKIDATGILGFKGSSYYEVGGNKYVFRFSDAPNYGMFFNSTDMLYEFRDANARTVFSVNANSGDGYFLSGVRIGNSGLATSGNLRWNGLDFQGYNGNSWLSLTGGQSWGLQGNAGTNPATSFIGTTDAQPFVFKVNNLRSGYLDYDAEKANTSFGYQALNTNTTGYKNTAFGYKALFNSNESLNTAIGAYALYNTTSDFGVAVGYESLRSNTTGHFNTATGYQSMYNNTTGGFNCVFGYSSLYQNTTGSHIVAIGPVTLQSNTSGDYNIGIGGESLNYNTTGSHNTAIGYKTLEVNKTGDYNTAIGEYAGPIGLLNNLTNTTALGYSAFIYQSNQVRVGNTSVTSIGGYANWTNVSDGRFKKNINENVPGLDFIKMLKPVTYNLDIKGINNFLAKDQQVKDASGNENYKLVEDEKAITQKEKELQTGFVAQEVEQAAKKLGYQFSGVDVPANDKGLYGLRYAEFVVPLVKAVQELSAMNDALSGEVNELTKQLNNQQNQIDELKALITGNKPVGSVGVSKTVSVNNATLDNFPNPFNRTTTINYTLTQQNSTGKIIITDNTGKKIKELNLPAENKGSIQVDAFNLSSGTYQYSLYENGRLLVTKQMVVIK